MDLVTLVTACALSADPKLMHALVWHQSGGEPWAVSVQNEPMPRVYSSVREAVSEARAAGTNSTIRVGLTGLSTAPSRVTKALFLPCRNVALAARQIAKLVDRCEAHPRLKSDQTLCAVAVYRGSWQQPNVKFAEAVLTSIAKGDVPNFDMPKDTSIDFLDVASEMAPLHPDARSPEPATQPDDRERGWSSASFPSNPQQPASESNDGPSDRPAAEQTPSSRVSNAHPSTAKAPIDGLFVPRSSDRRPQ